MPENNALNWVEQAEAMMKTWADAQKTVWSGWYDMAQKAPGAAGKAPEMPDLAAIFKPGLDVWTQGSGMTSEKVADEMINSQQSMLQTLALLTKARRIVVPHVEKGTDWQSDLKAFAEAWNRETFGAPESLGETTADMNELWNSYLAEWGPLLKPWLMSANQMVHGYLGQGLLTGGLGLDRLMAFDSSTLPHLLSMDPETDLAFRRLAEIPRVGSSREQVAALLHAFDAFMEFRVAVTKYRALVGEAMRDAMERTMDRLAALAAEGESINTIRGVNRLWLEVADEAFTDVYSSQKYADVMRELSSSGMRYKIEQRKVVEMVLEAFDIPTRSELDDAYKSLYELRKDMKAVKKELAAARKQAAAKDQPAAAAPAKPSKRATSTRKAPAAKRPTRRKPDTAAS
jgi:class III poly(R)-hydroxyalkanoic acid synthase PhaE subunit